MPHGAALLRSARCSSEPIGLPPVSARFAGLAPSIYSMRLAGDDATARGQLLGSVRIRDILVDARAPPLAESAVAPTEAAKQGSVQLRQRKGFSVRQRPWKPGRSPPD